MTMNIDRDEIIRTAQLLIAPGGITELRALDATLNGSRYPGTVSGYFDSSAKLADAAASITHARGIYIIPNAVRPDLLARAANRIRTVGKSDPLTADHDIIGRRWLPIDVDAARPAGISASDEERQAAHAKVEAIYRWLMVEQGWPDPILADSGNGYHLLYRIDLPADDRGLVQRCLAALAARFDDDRAKVDTSVHNPARIWKLYGTLACKGDSTPDRPHRMARLMEAPPTLELVSETMLVALGGSVEAREKLSTHSTQPTHSTSCAGTFDLSAWIGRHLPDATGPEPWKGGGQMWKIATCPWNADHQASAYVGQQPSGAIVAGCHHNSCSWNWHELRARFDPPGARGSEHACNPSGGERAGNELAIVKASQLGGGDKADWVWHGYLARGYITLLVGLWKAGKSTLLSHLLKAIGGGGEDIGGVIAPGKVLVVSEEGAGLWAGRRDDLGISDNIHFIIRPFKGRPSRADWEYFVKALAKRVRVNGYAGVVFDTLSAVNPVADENDAAGMMAALTPLHHLTEARAAVLILHHPRKGDGNEGQASRGSGALPGFVDIILELRRFEPENRQDRRRVLSAYSRFDETPTEVVLELGDEGYAVVGTKADAKRDDRRAVVMALLSGNAHGLTIEQLLERWPTHAAIRPGRRTLGIDLDIGFSMGLWNRAGNGVKGQPYRYRPHPQSDSGTLNPLDAEIEYQGDMGDGDMGDAA